MNISEIFIRRPIATALMTAGLVAFGAISFTLLPVAALPNVEFPTITVSATFPGASPDVMASTVATPLEDQFTAIPGLASMTSTSGLGSTSITLQFDLSTNITADAGYVDQAIQAASALLPKNLPAPPTYKIANPADAPILIFGVHSDAYPIQELDQYANILIGQSLSRVSGVGQVVIAGQAQPAVEVQLDPQALAAKGLGFAQVSAGLTSQSVIQPTGNLEGGRLEFPLDVNQQLETAARIPQSDRRLQQWRARRAWGHRDRGRRPKEPAHGRMVRDEAGRSSPGLQGARRQHARCRRPNPGDDAATREVRPAIGPCRPCLRPLALDPLLGLGRRVHARAGARARRHGDLPFPAQVLGDRDSEHHPAGRDRRDLRGDVSAQLQHRQSVADGAHDFHRLPRRRRDRDDREHRSPHRGGEAAARGRPRRRGRDRFHHSLHHPLARRGLHSGSLHGGCGGTPFPRIRDDDRSCDLPVGLRVADADPNDVRPVPDPGEPRAAGSLQPVARKRLQPDARPLRSRAYLDVCSPVSDANGQYRPDRPDGRPLHRHSEGVPARTGHRHLHRRRAGARGHRVRDDRWDRE